MTFGQRDFFRPGRSVAVGTRGMAATSHPDATLAALDILRAGGNAVDAAIAAVAVQGVVDPHMTGVGGDCFAIVAKGAGKPVAVNGSGRAPARAERTWFAGHGLSAIPEASPHAVTIPGAVDAWCLMSAEHGRLGLDRVLAPAIRFAEEGFQVTPRAALDWARYAERLRVPGGGAAAYLPRGEAPATGDRLTHPALARTLRRIAAVGRSAFYEGAVADEIVAVLASLGGLHQASDFANARADFVEPIAATYRDHTLWECPPNGQGVAALLIARILDGFDLAAPSLSEADRIHLHAEATKAAYRQRDAFIADPAHHPLDPAWLLSDEVVARLRSAIDPRRASAPFTLEMPKHRDTVTVAVVDDDGTAVALINSIFMAFGSGIYAPQAGVLLHNRGSGFRLDEGHPNTIAPNKRPFHTIIPALLARDGQAVMPFGVMGGQYQAAGHAQILVNLIDRGLDVQAASDAPRAFAYDGQLSLEPTFAPEVADDLAGRGHKVAWADEPIGGFQGILIDKQRGALFGGSDHRKDGVALGF
jgi:gamma-glutamyltranspeptidase/glutathione hydrolase